MAGLERIRAAAAELRAAAAEYEPQGAMQFIDAIEHDVPPALEDVAAACGILGQTMRSKYPFTSAAADLLGGVSSSVYATATSAATVAPGIRTIHREDVKRHTQEQRTNEGAWDQARNQ